MCDTFVALSSGTADNSIIFGKNSDREPNEAQALEFYPAREYKDGSELKCTHLTIPQVNKTRAIIISRPFWMWGAEMGANDAGVVMGNEAVWTRMPLEKKTGLAGMDLQRLALERSKTAEHALEIITELLAEFGQGGPCGYEIKGFVYHNSFLIADPETAWILETAGNLWAAKKVVNYYSISNGLSIGESYDLSHPELIETARRKGWLKKGQEFHFARCYADWFYTTFSKSKMRRSRSLKLMESTENKMNPARAFNILRDHGSKNYSPGSHLFSNRICAHSANAISRNAAQSTSSFVAHLSGGINTFWATGTSAPCTSIFKPLRLGADLPDLGPRPRGNYEPESLWWKHEILHRLILKDFRHRIKLIEDDRDKLENHFLETGDAIAANDYSSFSKSAFAAAQKLESEFVKRLHDIPVLNRSDIFFSSFWKKQNKNAGMSEILD